MFKPQKISEELVIENPFLKVLKKDFVDEKGNESSFLITGHNKKKTVGTFILPITSDNRVLYLEEFRYGPERFVINFPVGMLDDNIGEMENCKKELLEETGYASENIEFLTESIIENYFEGEIRYYIAYDCKKVQKQDLENGEIISVFSATIEEFEQMILEGKILSSKTSFMFLYARRKGLI